MILREMCRAKIHRLTVTDADINYEGSITIDKRLLKKSGISAFEKVQVVNVNNGNRFDTYIIEGKEGSGEVCLNGGAARMCSIGDPVIVMAYALVDESSLKKFSPVVVIVDKKNKIKRIIK